MAHPQVYAIERGVFPRPTELSIREANELARKVCAHFGVPEIRVRRPRRGARGSSFHSVWNGPINEPVQPEIVLSPVESYDWVMCHELAHYLKWYHHGGFGHGAAWEGYYVEVVEFVMGPRAAARLARALRTKGQR